MEHRALTTSPLLKAASENLVATYVALGTAVQGAQTSQEEGFILCQGPLPHAICNFATQLRLDPWSARRLRDLALAQKVFQIYSLPDDLPDERGELLERAGFRHSYRLVQMVCEHPDPGPLIEPFVAEDAESRARVATFMGRQFFARQAESFRRRVAAATAHADAMQLFGIEERAKNIAAVMLCHGGGILGVYNLCVASARRGRGIGSGLLNWTLALARESDRAVTLQCEPRLEGWYAQFGFVSTGVVDVYCLAKRDQDDIIL